MHYEENDFHITYKKDSQRAREVIESLSHPKQRLRVDYKNREAILKVFIPQLADKYRTEGHTGVKAMARALCEAMDFMDADGGSHSVNPECIEKELSNLYHRMYPENQE